MLAARPLFRATRATPICSKRANSHVQPAYDRYILGTCAEVVRRRRLAREGFGARPREGRHFRQLHQKTRYIAVTCTFTITITIQGNKKRKLLVTMYQLYKLIVNSMAVLFERFCSSRQLTSATPAQQLSAGDSPAIEFLVGLCMLCVTCVMEY